MIVVMTSLNLADVIVTFLALLRPQNVLLSFARIAGPLEARSLRLVALLTAGAAACVGALCALTAPWLATFFHISVPAAPAPLTGFGLPGRRVVAGAQQPGQVGRVGRRGRRGGGGAFRGLDEVLEVVAQTMPLMWCAPSSLPTTAAMATLPATDGCPLSPVSDSSASRRSRTQLLRDQLAP